MKHIPLPEQTRSRMIPDEDAHTRQARVLMTLLERQYRLLVNMNTALERVEMALESLASREDSLH